LEKGEKPQRLHEGVASKREGTGAGGDSAARWIFQRLFSKNEKGRDWVRRGKTAQVKRMVKGEMKRWGEGCALITGPTVAC